jgi:glutamate dehydrogenase
MSDHDSKERFLPLLLEEVDRRIGDRNPAALKAFATDVLDGMDVEDLRGRQPADVFGAIACVWDALQHREGNASKVQVFNPGFEQHGWGSRHTAIIVLTDGIPFVSESLRLELTRRGLVLHILQSSDITVLRDEAGNLEHLYPASVPAGEGRQREALVYIEFSRVSDAAQLQEIAASLAAVIADVRRVVSDFEPMCTRVREIVADFESLSGPLPPALWQEHRALFEWLLERHFTFLGYEELRVDYSGAEPRAWRVDGSPLGLLRDRESTGASYLLQEVREAGGKPPQQVAFFKSSRRSRVHRLAYPDYITLKCFDAEGRVVGQHSFLGLFTAVVYTMDPESIPIIRRKVAEIIERSHPEESSHRRRSLRRVLEVLPRDELLQGDVDSLQRTALRIFHIQERQQVRLFLRADGRRRFASCLVYWPRDTYRTELRERIETLLREALGAVESEFTTFFSESVLVRTHFVMRLAPDAPADWDVPGLESLVQRIARRWEDQLSDALVESFGEERGSAFFRNYCAAFPAGYKDDHDPELAVADIRKIDELETEWSLGAHFHRRLDEAADRLHLRLYSCERAVELSEVVPIFENLGMRSIAERPHRLRRTDRRELWVHDFTLAGEVPDGVDFASLGEVLGDAVLAIMRGQAENDPYNRLVAFARIGWREVAVLRAYGHYLKQLRAAYSQHFIAATLARHREVALELLALFAARFDPGRQWPAGGRAAEEEARAGRILGLIDRVEQLNEDQVLRSLLALIRATLRTNHYRPGERAALAFKFDGSRVPGMPRPIPMFEIWVHSPRVAGVHLRRGRVARGGLRWSDRVEDFRTEVLGLVKAQQVKNAVIVPVGAKGCFVARRLSPGMSREETQAEGVACYSAFVEGLLDLTDNIVGGVTVPPPGVVCHDELDPYLVVAADKGTASFSDIANGIARRFGFWLGDAFASGGSVGYDHKKMAITARGAWVCVERHFRERGIDVQRSPFTMVGIGDMSGDVFGNGLLRSRQARLIAAFDHRHVFVDPDPDPERSYAERERLFALPRSSWADYDPSLISEGGGVFPRSAKSLSVTPAMQRALGIEASRLTPTELVAAILAAPVDLLWNGGIGTYIKSARESHADVGDKANDGCRIDATALRARVVGEGGNLGMTQLARIDFAAAGGACNTDFIDNSGGVDCSDHEVNIKILLNAVVAAGEMTEAQRVRLLEGMREEVAERVLENNYGQAQAISIAAREAWQRSNEYRALMNALEARGLLDRGLEFLPSDEALAERHRQKLGLTRPELAVLTCYVKGQLKLDILASGLPDEAFFARVIESAFPRALAGRFPEAMREHVLRREIVATQLANEVVDLMGLTFVERLCQSAGSSVPEVLRAFAIARDILELPRWWQAVECLDNVVPAALQLEVQAELQRAARLASRWLLQNRRSGGDPAAQVIAFGAGIRDLRADMGELLVGDQLESWQRRHGELLAAGFPQELATVIAGSAFLLGGFGIVDIAAATGRSVTEVAEIAFELNERLGFYRFGRQLAALQVEDRWQAMARESFLDELDWQVRAIVTAIARLPAGLPPTPLEAWMAAKAETVSRWRSTLQQIREGDPHDYAMFTVAVRGLLELAQAEPSP